MRAPSCGDRVLVARNAHKSLVNGLELLRLKTEWVYPDVLPCGICGSISPQAVRNALKKYALQGGGWSPLPPYEGVISDVKGIAEAAHEQGALLIVDGAHGAHLDISPYFVGGGVKQGADAVVCGIHKTLPALTQTALLHCADSLPAVKVSRAHVGVRHQQPLVPAHGVGGLHAGRTGKTGRAAVFRPRQKP